MSCNPIESFTPSETGSVVDRSDLSAKIQQELINAKLHIDSSLSGHQLKAASGCSKSDGAHLTKAHQGSAKGVGANDIAIPPSSSIYDRSKNSSLLKLHKADDLSADERAQSAGRSIQDAHSAPLASGAAKATGDTHKGFLNSDPGKAQASRVPNGDQFMATGPAVRLGNAFECLPSPIQEYHVIGPAIPLGKGDPAPGFLNPFIATPGSDKKSP